MIVRTAVLTAALLAAAPAVAQSHRAGAWEIYIGPVFTDGKNYSFDGGTSARTDTGVGFNFGFAKNLDAHWNVGMDLVWSEQDYHATVMSNTPNLTGPRTISGTLETYTVRFFGTYNFSTGPFTPLVTAGLGWTYLDSNIPSGLPENVCWYYPYFYGYCTTYVPTHATTKFSYNAGAGVRYDFGKGLFRFLVNSQWADFGSSSYSNAIQYRLDIGTKF